MKAFPWKPVVIYACLSIAAILWALPVWWTVINATKSTSDFFAHPFYALPREFNLLSNIRTAWDNAALGTGFINSIIYGVVGAAASIVIASLAAYAIVVLRIRGGFTIFLVIFSATVFPLQMYIVPLFKMYNSIGLYDSRLGMLIFYTAISVPFCTLVLRGFYSTVPNELREAALSGRGARVPDPALCLCPPVRVGGPGAFPFPIHLDLERPAVRDRIDVVTIRPARDGQPEQSDGHLRRVEPACGTGRHADSRVANARTVLLPPPLLHAGAFAGSSKDITPGVGGDRIDAMRR